MSEPKDKTCPFCEKKGLAILPLRAAVGRTDTKFDVLDLPSGFKQDEVASIDLPANSAQYTTRLLRPGYLYVFNEVRGEWKGYVVTPQGFLYGFDPDEEATPADADKIEFSCYRTGEEYIARCITIPDAEHAGKVWLGFSDTAWTQDVLDKHRAEAYRKRHMRVVNAQDWVKGSTDQDGTAEFTKLTSVVNEFTHKGVKHGKQPSQSKKKNPNTLDPVVIYGYPAFGFSPHAFQGIKHEADGLLDWGKKAKNQPMMTTVPDPVGISMELNQLALHRASEWEDEPERKKRFESSAQIENVRNAVANGAVKQEADDRVENATWAVAITRLLAPTASRRVIRPDWAQRAGSISLQEQGKIAQENWEGYRDSFNHTKRQDFLTQYQSDLGDFDRTTIKSLDRAYIAWLNSSALAESFNCNYSVNDPDNGRDYVLTLKAVLKDASGRNAPRKFVHDQLKGDPNDKTNFVMRALGFNQDDLIKDTIAACERNADGKDPVRTAGLDIYQATEKLYDRHGSADWKELAGHISALYFEVGGGVIEHLSNFVDKGMAWASASLSEKYVLGSMRAALQAGSPGMELVGLSFSGSQEQFSRALAIAVADASGGHSGFLRSRARQIANMNPKNTLTGRALLAVDSDEYSYLSRYSPKTKSSTRAAGIAEEINTETFERLYGSTVEKGSKLQLKGGVVGAIFSALSVRTAFKELADAEASANKGLTIPYMKVSNAMSTLTGALADVAAGISKSFEWGTKAPPLLGQLMKEATYTEALTGVGKLLGAIGGIVAGVLEIIDGVKEFRTDHVMGFTMMALGGIGVMAGLAIFFGGEVAGPIGIVVGILVAIGIWVVSWLRDDDIDKWLKQTMYFGLIDQFDSLETQEKSFKALAHG